MVRLQRKMGLCIAAMCIVAGIGTLRAAGKPYDELVSYQYGQNRSAVEVLEKQILRTPADQKSAVEQRLIATLTAPKATMAGKQMTCRYLAVVGSEACISAVQPLLSQEKFTSYARFALQPIPGKRVTAALCGATASLKGQMLEGVAQTLGMRRDESAVPTLAKLTGNSDSAVAYSAYKALGNIGTAKALEALQAAKPLAKLTIAKQRGLILCANRLVQAGYAGKAVPVFAALYKAADASVTQRKAAIAGLAGCSCSAAKTLVLAALDDKSLAVQKQAIVSFVAQEGNSADALAGKWEKLPAMVRCCGLEEIAARKAKSFSSLAAMSIKASDSKELSAAAKALAAVGQPSDLAVLLPMAVANNQAALRALTRMPGKEIDQKLLALLKTADEKQGKAILQILPKRATRNCMPTLLALVQKSSSRRIQYAAADAMVDLGEKGDVSKILDAISTVSSSSLKARLAKSCGKIARKYSVQNELERDVIGRYGKASDTRLKMIYLTLLTEIGGKAGLDLLQKEAKSTDQAIQDMAVRALVSSSELSVAPVLEAIAKTSTNRVHKILALRGYIELAGQCKKSSQAIAMLKTAGTLAKERTQEKGMIIAVLQKLGSPQSVKLLILYVNDKQVSAQAVDALGTLVKKANKRSRKAIKAELKASLEQVQDSAKRNKLAKLVK